MAIETFKRDFEIIKPKIDFLKKMKCDFSVSHSNYTTTIEYPNGDKDKFITNSMSKRTFIAYNKVRSDILKHDLDFENLFEKYGLTDKNKYFENKPNIVPFRSDSVINIDIKGAYPSSLFNFGLITSETLDFLNSLKKINKLASLGMLASKKTITNYKGGLAQSMDIKTNKMRNVFILLVRQVDKIMSEISKIAGDYFIYFWVDGIYLKEDTPPWTIDQIKNFLTENKYEYHYDNLKDFELKRNGEYLEINFIKEEEKKQFKFPDKNINLAVNIFINSLNKEIKKNE